MGIFIRSQALAAGKIHLIGLTGGWMVIEGRGQGGLEKRLRGYLLNEEKINAKTHEFFFVSMCPFLPVEKLRRARMLTAVDNRRLYDKASTRASREILMIRSLIAILMFACAGTLVNGQPGGATVPAAAVVPQSKAEFPGKPELLRRIALYEAAARKAETAHTDRESLVKIYANLGGLYEDAAMYPKAENTLLRAISLLREGPQDELAEEIGHLAVLHLAMGEVREAEKNQMQALAIRERVGDQVGIALTWNDLADLYFKKRQYKKALDYAQRAMGVLADRPDVSASDRIAVRQTLALALCGVGNCEKAISLLKDAIELSKGSFGVDSLPVGVDEYLLGYVYWQNGDMNDAAEWMGRGIARMKVDLGWGHAIYVNAVGQYAKFLRKTGQTEAAASAESEVHQAEALVDVRTLIAVPDTFRSTASR
jgi:tetratricopeptide (TPR) repeat protein